MEVYLLLGVETETEAANVDAHREQTGEDATIDCFTGQNFLVLGPAPVLALVAFHLEGTLVFGGDCLFVGEVRNEISWSRLVGVFFYHYLNFLLLL